MRAIIVGAGDVGYDVARMLSLQRHDVTVVDMDPEKVAHVRETLDVLALEGSGTSTETLQKARIEDADLLVAVTDVDEVNIIASMIAERVGKEAEATITIARVRSGEFTGSDAVLSQRDFGIDHIIHPEQSTANEVVSLLRRASATDLVDFCGDRVQLVGIRVDSESPVVGMTLAQLAQHGAHLAFRVMGISRGVRTIVPSGTETVQRNDQIFVIVPSGQVCSARRRASSATRWCWAARTSAHGWRRAWRNGRAAAGMRSRCGSSWWRRTAIAPSCWRSGWKACSCSTAIPPISTSWPSKGWRRWTP